MKSIRHFRTIQRTAVAEPALNEDRYKLELRATIENMKEVVDQGRWVEWRSYESFTQRFIEELRSCKTFADVGAEVGFYTYLALKHMPPGGTIYAFEPDPVCHSLLNEFFGGNENVILSNCAVSNSGGRLRMVKPRGTSSTCADVEGDEFEVDCIALDDVLPADEIDMIKMDVEGAEAKVFGGMERILSKRRVKIFLELHSWVDTIMPGGTDFMERMLENHGYHCYNWDYGKSVRAARLFGTRLLLLPEESSKQERVFAEANPLRRVYLSAKVNAYLRARRSARSYLRGY